jgi:hypothetical protein
MVETFCSGNGMRSALADYAENISDGWQSQD